MTNAQGASAEGTDDADATERPDPERFFEKREGLIVPELAHEVARDSRVRLGVDGRLYRYAHGVYLSDGREFVKARTRTLLAEKYKRRHRDEVLGFFGDSMPTLGVEQPEGIVNVANGLLDWRTGELLPHDPAVLSTIQLPVAWNPDATCPRIERFFGEVVPDAVEFMFEVFGYAIYPKLPIHKALLLFGPGRNGKGTTLRLLERFVGKPNVANVPLQTFGERVFAAATVYGKLINLAGDLDARDMARSDAFKMLTGGDSVYAEHKFKPPFAFTSYALLVFAANEAPISRDQTEGYFSRWLIVPFLNRYVGANDDTKLDSKLQSASELEGLLVRAVLGLRALLERGYFDEPGSVQEAGESYRTKLDSVAGFVDDECTLGEECQVYRSDLYRRYVAWSADNGRRPLNSATFYEHVRNRYGATDHKSGGKRFIRGIGFAALTHDAFGDDA